LFSKHGFTASRCGDVAQRVGIHTTLLHYYFKDKTNLFEAVFARRAPVTVGRRMVALEQYEKRGRRQADGRGCLHAFLDTTSTFITRVASTG